jgi:DNA-binding transcriptional regulator YdaS (Cro superfamily)
VGILYGQAHSLPFKPGMPANRAQVSEQYLAQALKISKEIRAWDQISTIENALSELFRQTRRPELALEHYKNYVAARDSVYNEENAKKSVRAEMNFAFEKQQAANEADHEKELAIAQARHDKEKEKQKIVIICVVSGLLLALVFAVFVFRAYRQKQAANIIITRQKQETEGQKKLIEEKQREILDSIHYARRIQKALMPSERYIDKKIPKSR